MEEERTQRGQEDRRERPDDEVGLVAAKGTWCPVCSPDT